MSAAEAVANLQAFELSHGSKSQEFTHLSLNGRKLSVPDSERDGFLLKLACVCEPRDSAERCEATYHTHYAEACGQTFPFFLKLDVIAQQSEPEVTPELVKQWGQKAFVYIDT